MQSRSFVLMLFLMLTSSTRGQDKPPILDCTRPEGADAKTVVEVQRAWAKHLGEKSHEKVLPLDKAGKVTVEVVLLPPGKYYRGEGKSATLITLTQPLWVGKYEVTQHQYAAIMGSNPSHFARLDKDAALYPVECVSHVDALKFCDSVSANTTGEFRLLTEAEWEYACRAGTRTKFYNGDSDDKLSDNAQFAGNNRKTTEKIGSKAPNAFGLFDMSGNVWEWCVDYWTPAYDMRTTTDPIGPDAGQGCVTRGGSWASALENCRSFNRGRDAETYGGSHLGFRIAWTATARRTPPTPLDCSGPEGADARAVVAAQKAWAKYLGEPSHERTFPLDRAGKVTIDMVLLPPGKYYRGDEKKPTLITLTQPLWVGKYEATQKQYEAVMGVNPSHFKKNGADAALYPVEKLSHRDAVKFCKIASENIGGEFRLLWEAEWEYAYRAGTRTRFYNGDANEKAVDIAQCTENNFVSTAKVGTKAPNAFGLHDMGGNVAEWCADAWEKDFIETTTTDPHGPGKGTIVVNRGNAWDSYARTCNATARVLSAESYAGCQIGFRLARVAAKKSEASKLEIIDTHVHFFDPKRPTAPKPRDDKPLSPPLLPADLKKVAQPHGVVGALIVEASSLLEDNQWWLDLAAKDSFIVGVVGRLDPVSDDFEKNLRRFARDPLFRGIRIYHNEVKAGLKGNLVQRCKVLEELGLTLDVNGGPDMPADVAVLAAKLPKLRIVINHAANLRIDGKEPPRAWREGMEAAAKYPKVFCKVSALVEQTGKKPAPRDVEYYRPVLDVLWTLFGEERLLFGSNWPVSNGGAPYETVVGIVRDYFTSKGERAAAGFFLNNSQSVYQWRPRQITNSLGMRLAYIPPGKFLMGSPENEPGREKGESQHEVELTKGFYLGSHEVTVGQFKRFVQELKYQTDAEKDGKGAWGLDNTTGKFVLDAKYTWRNPGFEQTDDHPVVNVSWTDAVAFCRWLSHREKKTYRLPTEAEWEYACRARTATAYSFGDDPEGLATAGNIADATARGKFPAWTLGIMAKDGHAFSSPVGQFKPNAFGLHDMHGNVWEWCADWYDPEGYTKEPQKDPAGLATGTMRVQRGSGWSSAPQRARSASRVGRDPSSYKGCYLGFRIVLGAEQQ